MELKALVFCSLCFCGVVTGFIPRSRGSMRSALRTHGLAAGMGASAMGCRDSAFSLRADASCISVSSSAGKPRFKKIVRRVVMGLAAVMLAFVRGVKNAAAGVSSGGIKGWDLYGRVPNDDFLFSNYHLTDPNLLKRSYVETIMQELPPVLGNFKRRKRISELMSIVSGLGYFALVMAAIGLLYKTAMAANLRRSQAEEEMGRGFSASAISKKAARKGKKIDGMEDGWVDMEEDDDDEPPPPPKKK